MIKKNIIKIRKEIDKMKKFTSSEFAKLLKLNVGDIIELNGTNFVITGSYTLREEGSRTTLFDLPLYVLIDKEFTRVKDPEFIGELRCTKDVDCVKCPLKMLNCLHVADTSTNNTLFEILNSINNMYPDKEVYDIILNRLNSKINLTTNKEEK